MASQSYPQTLPGVSVNSNSYSPEWLVEENSIQSGPPTFELRDDTATVAFDVAWSFSASEVQLFRGWYKWALRQGSKTFDIELWVEGWDGAKNTVTHECNFRGRAPAFTQQGRRWLVTATLLAIEEQVSTEAEYDQLAILDAGFPDGIKDTLDALTDLVEITIPHCLGV